MGDLHLEPGHAMAQFEEARRQLITAINEPGVAAPRVVQLGAAGSPPHCGSALRPSGAVIDDFAEHLAVCCFAITAPPPSLFVHAITPPPLPTSAHPPLPAGDLGGYKFRPGSRDCFQRGLEYLAGFGAPTTLVLGNHE